MLGGRWKYVYGRSRSGKLEKGFPEGWDWSKHGGKYENGRDFFSVHWEVQLDPPKSADNIRLHVESPRYVDDPVLNDLKFELAEALRGSDVERVVLKSGYSYRVGSRTSRVEVRSNKSTTVFHVVLTDGHRGPTHKEEVEAVHAAIGPYVTEVLRPFTGRLERHFRV